MWTAARQIAVSSKRNTWEIGSSSLGLLKKAYCMTLVVIVCAYRAFVGKASIRRIDKTT